MHLFSVLIAATPAFASFASASTLSAADQELVKRNLPLFCCNGQIWDGELWKRGDPEVLETRNFCLRTRNCWIHKCPDTQTCNPLFCPMLPNSEAFCTCDKCDFSRQNGAVRVGDTCVMPCQVSSCPTVSNGVVVCTTNQTDFNCNTDYNKVNGACVPNTPVCNVTKCPSCPNGNGTPICTSAGKCDITCNTGYNKVNGACVPSSPSCRKKSIAFYDNFQTTKNGEPAVTVAFIDACAAYCLTWGCASFDFWGGNQCGIQIGGGGFDGFQYSPGVVHGVPGQCSDYDHECPADVANKACYNKSVCARKHS